MQARYKAKRRELRRGYRGGGLVSPPGRHCGEEKNRVPEDEEKSVNHSQEHTLGRIDVTQEDFRRVFHEYGTDPTLRLLATSVPLLSGTESRAVGLWLKERAAEEEGGDAGLRAAAACLLHIATLKGREIQ